MYEQRDKSVPRKLHADYRDRRNWGITKTRNIEWSIALTIMQVRTMFFPHKLLKHTKKHV